MVRSNGDTTLESHCNAWTFGSNEQLDKTFGHVTLNGQYSFFGDCSFSVRQLS